MMGRAACRGHPRPEGQATVLARRAAPVEMVRRVGALQLEPVAMLALRGDVYLRFEGFSAGVKQQREKLRDLEEAPWPAYQDAPVRLKVAALPTQFAQVEKAIAPLQARLEWLPTLGLGFVFAQSADAATIESARRELLALGGSLTVEAAPFPVDVFGPAPAALQLHQAVKAQLDPQNILAPGRFLGRT